MDSQSLKISVGDLWNSHYADTITLVGNMKTAHSLTGRWETLFPNGIIRALAYYVCCTDATRLTRMQTAMQKLKQSTL